MCRVRTMGRGEAAKRLAMAASQCSLPRCTCTTSVSGSQPSSARRSRASLAACSAAPERQRRDAPDADRARAIDHAGLAARLADEGRRVPGALELGADARGPVRVRRPPPARHEVEHPHGRTLSGSALTSGRAAPGAAGRSPPSAPRAARGCVARWPGGAPPRPWPGPGRDRPRARGGRAQPIPDDRRRRAVPVRPWATASGSAPTARATTGRPAAIASSAARQDSSDPAAISANTSSASSTAGRSPSR